MGRIRIRKKVLRNLKIDFKKSLKNSKAISHRSIQNRYLCLIVALTKVTEARYKHFMSLLYKCTMEKYQVRSLYDVFDSKNNLDPLRKRKNNNQEYRMCYKS
jgi:hypothetical protein